MIIGAILFIWRPIYLKPPLFRLTHLIYASIAFIWLPVLVVCLRLQPTGSRLISVAIVTISAPTLICCTIFWLMSLLWTLGNAQDCTQETIAAGLVRYTCDVGIFSDARQDQLFEGPINSPFMFPVRTGLKSLKGVSLPQDGLHKTAFEQTLVGDFNVAARVGVLRLPSFSPN